MCFREHAHTGRVFVKQSRYCQPFPSLSQTIAVEDNNGQVCVKVSDRSHYGVKHVTWAIKYRTSCNRESRSGHTSAREAHKWGRLIEKGGKKVRMVRRIYSAWVSALLAPFYVYIFREW